MRKRCAPGFFNDSGCPVASGYETLDFPNLGDANAFALAISGNRMLPVYRKGDIIVVAPNAEVRPGDRVVVKTRSGEVLAKQ